MRVPNLKAVVPMPTVEDVLGVGRHGEQFPRNLQVRCLGRGQELLGGCLGAPRGRGIETAVSLESEAVV